MKEILAGGGIRNAFVCLGITAKQTYDGDSYEVWELSDYDFNRLCANENEDAIWEDDWGWWRYAKGSSIEDYPDDYPINTFIINSQEMLGYFDSRRYYDVFEDEYDDMSWYYTYDYLTDYISNEFGASTESNVCAIAKSLAKLNNITLAELFNKYEEK